jgi:sulfur carrier protein ThiS
MTYFKVDETNARVQELAKTIGCEPKLVAAQINREAYRKAYSARPEVKEARKAYSAERNEQLKMVAALLKEVK